MAERELTFRILTTAETAALDSTARALDDVARGASDLAPDLDKATRGLDDLDIAGSDAATTLDKVDTAVRDVDLDKLGTEARDAAREVDTAFDKIARSSKQSADTVDRETGSLKRSFKDAAGEGQDTAREMAASFDGTSGSVLDAFQEMGANAGIAFGPVAAAAGIAATVGVGYIRAEQEKLKILTQDLLQQMLDAGGALTEAAIDSRVQTMATEDPAAFVRQKRLLDDLGISWRDYTRAKAGDGEAAKRAIQQIADLSTTITDNAAAAGSASGEMYAQQQQLNDLAGELGTTATAYDIAKEATEGVTSASSKAGDAMSQAKADAAALRESLANPITANVKVFHPSRGELAGIRRDIADGIGPIIVDVVARPKSTALFYPGSRSVP